MEQSLDTHMQSQSQLWKLIYGIFESLVLRCSVELGLADIINSHGGHITLSELASNLPYTQVNTDHLSRIMRLLVHMKLFNLQETAAGDKLYGLEPTAKLLLKDAEKSMAPLVLGMIDKDFTLPWHFLKDGLSGEGTVFEKTMGMTMWDYLESHPEKSQLFNEIMASETRLLTSYLIDGCKDVFGNLEYLVDVGGGNGTTLKAISKAFPHIKCTVFDLPHVIDNSRDIPGVNRVAGDMFQFIPKAQAIILKLILHDWSDADCVKILRRCKEAVPEEGGKVIIVDVVLDDKEEHYFTKRRIALDVDMLVYTGGRERTKEDWKGLILEAGYKGFKIRDIGAVQSVIEVSPF